MVRRLTTRAVALAVPIALVAGPVLAATFQGPNSSLPPYVIPTQPEVSIKSIISVGDSPSNSAYRMVGIPDGLGAYDNNNGTFTVLMNHELGETAGVARAHGAKGAFVSKFVVRKNDLTVLSGEDLIKEVYLAGDGVKDTYAFKRLCSADLAETSAFFNRSGLLGLRSTGYHDGRIFLSGEETGDEGKAFAHISGGRDNGKSFELPHLGKFSYENLVANPSTGNATVTVSMDDTGGGQLYVYVGSKKNSGSPVDKAGLTGGSLFGIKASFTSENAAVSVADNSESAFTVAPLGDVSSKTGAQLQAASVAAGVTGFARPEDGSWDPKNPNDFYFVTTASMTEHSRLWRLRFVDPANPSLGGTLKMLLEGTNDSTVTSVGPKMMDNMTVDKRGKVFVQEDPGGNNYVAGIFEYDIKTDTVREIAEFDRNKFDPAVVNPVLTNDEESSGIIPVFDILGPGTYLLDAQVHKNSSDPELVQEGQLMAMKIHRRSGGLGLDLDLDVDLGASVSIN